MSLWVPTAYRLISKQESPANYVYTNLVEKFMGEGVGAMYDTVNQILLQSLTKQPIDDLEKNLSP